MAARRATLFSLDEVVDQVCADTDSGDEMDCDGVIGEMGVDDSDWEYSSGGDQADNDVDLGFSNLCAAKAGPSMHEPVPEKPNSDTDTERRPCPPKRPRKTSPCIDLLDDGSDQLLTDYDEFQGDVDEPNDTGSPYRPRGRQESPSPTRSSPDHCRLLPAYSPSPSENSDDESDLYTPVAAAVGRGRVRVRGRGVRTRGGGRGRGRGGCFVLPPRRQVRTPRAKNPRLLWTPANNDEFDPKAIPFTGTEGLRVRIPDDPEPIDFFNLYFTDEIFQYIADETNRYAEQFIAANKDNLKDNSRVRDWKKTDKNEMKTFFGLVMLMGIVHKPRMHMYWAKDELIRTPIFGEIMARDRFYILLRFLHFSDNKDPLYDAADPNRDRLYKVRPFIRKIQARCRRVYYPGKNLCVDESLLLYKGRLLFKQCIRTKRARFGIKFYELCTSEGITLDFIVYSAENIFRDHPDPMEQMRITERIPINLIQPYLGHGHSLFVDNWYTSPDLGQYLIDNATYICGTINPKRDNYAAELRTQTLEKGTAAFMKTGNILAVKFRALKNKSNNKPKEVYMLTTEGRATLEDTGRKDKEGHAIIKPSCIVSYNHKMGGVDMVDQLLHGLNTVRKTYKWYKKIVFRLLMQCSINAHRIYLKETDQRKDFLGFVKDVVTALVTSSPRLNKNVIARDTVHRLTGCHFPTRKDGKKGKHSASKMCRVCWARGFRSQSGREIKTVWICPDCPSQPGLHVDKDCFRFYHERLDYSRGPEEDTDDSSNDE
jgi:hypothetical protein